MRYNEEVLAQLPYAFVLNCFYFQGSKYYKQGQSLNQRYVYHYEMEYFIKSQGGMYLNDTYIEVEPGDVIIRKPGDITQGIMPYDCYLVVVGTSLDTYIRRHDYRKHEDVIQEGIGRHPILANLSNQRHLKHASELKAYFEAIHENHISESDTKDYEGHIQIETLLQAIDHIQGLISSYKEKESERFEKVIDYMHQHIDEKIYLEQLAKVAGLSLFHFDRVFKLKIGITAMAYLNQLRIDAGKVLLASTKESVTKISQQVGFDTASYFSYVFKQHVGMTPLAYRKCVEYDFSG